IIALCFPRARSNEFRERLERGCRDAKSHSPLDFLQSFLSVKKSSNQTLRVDQGTKHCRGATFKNNGYDIQAKNNSSQI
ncbi:hypothetical protein KI387_010201, partial [Taxus chinensis]